METTNTETKDGGDKIYVERLVKSKGQKPLSEPKRFALLAIGAFCAICGSSSYAFNLFSRALQEKYSFTQRDMSSINTVGMVFSYFLLPYGTIYDYFGPLPIYGLSCVLFPVGGVLFGLSFGDVIEGTTLRFCVFNAFLSLGSQLFDLASVVTLLSVFPTNRGGVVAITKTMMGLGSAIIGSLYFGFFNEEPSRYFYFLVAFVLIVGITALMFLRLPEYHLTGYEEKHLSVEEKKRRNACKSVYLQQKAPKWRFMIGLVIIIALVVYLPTQGALVAYLKLDRQYATAFAIVTIFVTFLFPLMALPYDALRCTKGDTEQSEEQRKDPVEAELNRVVNDKEDTDLSDTLEEGEVVTDVDYIAPQYQTTFLQSVCTLRLWTLLWAFFCGVGSEFVIIFNARFILGALEGEMVDDSMGTLLTVLNGVGSAVGRLLMSYFEIWSQKRKAEDRVPITLSLFVPTLMIIVSLTLFLVLPSNVLLVAFSIAAVGNGFCASVSILAVRTMYAKDPAKHYNFAYNALWMAAVILNRVLYGEWYTREANKQGSALCYGKNCVLMPMLFMIGLNFTGLAANAYTHLNYSRFSREVLAERRRLREEALNSGSS